VESPGATPKLSSEKMNGLLEEFYAKQNATKDKPSAASGANAEKKTIKMKVDKISPNG